MENPRVLKMYFLFKMGIFHCYVSLPEGTFPEINSEFAPQKWMLGIKDFLFGTLGLFSGAFALVLGGVK